jgi:hypothetical protein
MAYDQARRVKQTMVEALAAVMPTDPETGESVPVDYAWPGTNHQQVCHVWFVGARTESTYGGMRAGRKRRDQVTTFDIVIERKLLGQIVDGDGVNVLQAQADELVEDVAGVIDEWIADNVTLGQTTASDVPVDYGSVVSFVLTHGPIDVGVMSVGVLTVQYRLRPL